MREPEEWVPPGKTKATWNTREFVAREVLGIIESAYSIDYTAEEWPANACSIHSLTRRAHLLLKAPSVCAVSDLGALSKMLELNVHELRWRLAVLRGG